MGKQTTPKKAITPPKGRPTRGRGDVDQPSRVFGPTAQWVAAVFVIALVLLAIILFFDGGDFGVFNDQ